MPCTYIEIFLKSKRPARKYVPQAAACMQVSVQVCVFVFDMLMVDGEALIKHSLRERRSRVSQALPNMRPGYIQLAQSLELKVLPPEGQEPLIKVTQLPQLQLIYCIFFVYFYLSRLLEARSSVQGQAQCFAEKMLGVSSSKVLKIGHRSRAFRY